MTLASSSASSLTIHPSLQAKKYDEARDIWQARVNGGWRFYFRIEGDVYHLIDISPHPK